MTVRLHGNEEDTARRFNRTENVRPIPPSDPDFPAPYSRGNDSESLHRALDDTMLLGRAHSLAHVRQQVEVLGWALLVNSLTPSRHKRALPLAAWQADTRDANKPPQGANTPCRHSSTRPATSDAGRSLWLDLPERMSGCVDGRLPRCLDPSPE
ncbi:MAG: hypothetical protein HY240_03860 [Actinobacteria bacterium]|nr:hypothetical protein [Actinomycetota bacterium]